ncbi:MAG TPA: 30S ribosome-binding factor RbfA [Anaerolineaceae bacterium]|jgi:ribosome-binding factor A
MPSQNRLQRIGDRIREDLSEIILLKMNDPRLSGISVTDVKVDRELAFADVYVSVVEGIARAKEVIMGLEHANGFLRHELAARVELRVFPRLRFHWDPTPERADRIEKVLAELRQQPLSDPGQPLSPNSDDLSALDEEEKD